MRNRRTRVAWGVLALLSCCTSVKDDCVVADYILDPTEFDPETLLIRCDVAPELCDRPVTSQVNEPNFTVALDIVFVADGYTESTIGDFAARTATLISALQADDELIGRDPLLFNFHRVDVFSLSRRPIDRPLRTCVEDAGRLGSLRGGDMNRTALAAANAPDADFVIVLVPEGQSGRAAVGQSLRGLPMIYLVDEGFETITHELGHGLFGLGDEYSEFDGDHPKAARHDWETPDPFPPNLSLSPDEEWNGHVDGSVEGGDHWSRAVYRPTDSCRMLHHEHPAFCPVCAHSIAEALRARRGQSNGPPECLISAQLPVDGLTQLEVIARDPNGIETVRLNDNVTMASMVEGRIKPWFEISTSIETGDTIQVECTDTQGESTIAEFTAR